MYKKNIPCFGNSLKFASNVSPFVDSVVICRPISYFVKGGVDLTGISNRPPVPGAFADVESVSSGEVDAFTDPNVSRLDLMDYASVVASESQARSLKDAADV